MDINDVRGFATVLVMITFAGVCWWAFAPRRRDRFNEAANLPFADEPLADSKPLHPSADEARQD
jgi:cytochrome c oxidase cbb3-type subunit 4